MIDLEANITMHDRVTSKLSDDFKKFSMGINKLGSPGAKTNSGDVLNGVENVDSLKLKEDMAELRTEISKKVEFADINKVKGLVSEEIEKIEKCYKELSTNFGQIKSNFEAKSKVWDTKPEMSEVTKLQSQVKEID